MPSKTLYIMRHAETIFNVRGRCQGWCDSPLSERGVQQSIRAGRALAARNAHFDHAYSSSSERCCDTLEIATREAYGQPLPYEREKDFREVNFGLWEGSHAYRDAFELVQLPHFEAVEEGESSEEALARFERRLDEVMALPDHQSVLLVTSGGIALQFFYAHHADSLVDQRIFCNCLMYVYTWDNGVYRCQEIFAPDLSDLERDDGRPQIRSIEPPASY
jgi:probable phosphoglycerate mutase